MLQLSKKKESLGSQLDESSESPQVLQLQSPQPSSESEAFEGEIPRELKIHLQLLGVIAAGGGFFFGYNTTAISGALHPISQEFNLQDVQQSLIVSLISLGSLTGCLLFGRFSDKYGRLKTMVIQNILFLLGAVIITFAQSVGAIYASRFIIGLGAGASVVGDIPYLNEFAPAKYRGRISSFYEIFIVIGTVIGSVASLIFNSLWRVTFGVIIGFVAINSILLWFLPESPRWLIQSKQDEEAKKSLSIIFKTNDETRIESEFSHMKSTILNAYDTNVMNGDSKLNSSYRILTEDYKLPLILVVILLILSQFTGAVVM